MKKFPLFSDFEETILRKIHFEEKWTYLLQTFSLEIQFSWILQKTKSRSKISWVRSKFSRKNSKPQYCGHNFIPTKSWGLKWVEDKFSSENLPPAEFQKLKNCWNVNKQFSGEKNSKCLKNVHLSIPHD